MSGSGANPAAMVLRIFRSPDKWVMRSFAAIVFVMCLCFAKGQVRSTDDWIHALGTYLIALVIAVPYALITILLTPDYVLTSDGVARSVLGFRRHVRFADITSIRCRDVSGKGYCYRSYGLYTEGRERRPVVAFRGDYDDIAALIAVVQREASERAIPVLIRKMGWPVPGTHIPLPDEARNSMW